MADLDSLLLPGTRVYVSGSIHDVPRCREVMGQCAAAGCVLTHDWTRYKGPKMSQPEACRQLAAIRSADLFVLVVHPRLKAGWMEFGAAVASGVLHLAVLPHPDVSESMWYTLPNVTVCEPAPACELCGAGPIGRCVLPDEYDECPYGCSPER